MECSVYGICHGQQMLTRKVALRMAGYLKWLPDPVLIPKCLFHRTGRIEIAVTDNKNRIQWWIRHLAHCFNMMSRGVNGITELLFSRYSIPYGVRIWIRQ